MNEPISPTPAPRSRSRQLLLIAGAVLGVFAMLAATRAYVFAREMGMGWHHGAMTPEVISSRIEHGVKYMLAEVDATPDQKAKVTAILQSAAKDVQGMHEQHLTAHAQIQEIMSAQTIDRARLETVRTEQLQFADQASKRLVTAFADAAEVLTPEQRAKLIEEMQKEHHGWH